MNYPLTLQGTIQNIGANTVNNPQAQIKVRECYVHCFVGQHNLRWCSYPGPKYHSAKSLPNYLAPGTGVYSVEYISKINEMDQKCSQ